MQTTNRHSVSAVRSLDPLYPLLAFLLCGCAVLFAEKRSLVATVKAKSSSPARFIATLSMSTRAIEFDGFQGQSGNQSVRISAINHGRHGVEVGMSDRKLALFAPGTPFEFYSGNVAGLTNSLRFRISGVQNRTPCEFQVEVSNPAQFHDLIRVYVLSASAPM